MPAEGVARAHLRLGIASRCVELRYGAATSVACWSLNLELSNAPDRRQQHRVNSPCLINMTPPAQILPKPRLSWTLER
jgi:hypothetical protein